MNTPTPPNTPALPVPFTKRPHGRSLADFGPLDKAEKTLLDCCAKGEAAVIGNGVPADDSDPDTVVRASFLRFLLLGGDEQAPVHEQGVQLMGALVHDQLDLENCFVPHGIKFAKCNFDGPIIARDAHIAGLLDLAGSHLQHGLHADRLRCDSGVFLRDGFRSFGEVRLSGAEIGGNLQCSSGQFEFKEGHALFADGAVVKGDVFLDKQFKATGEVRLLGAQIGGTLQCSGGQFEFKEGHALSADRVVINGSVFLNEQFKATGEVRFLGAQIDGNLQCSGGQFQPEKGYALSADGAVVKGGVFMDKQFKATGQIRLLGAQISGNLACSGGQFEPQKGHALSADHAVFKGNVFLNEKFKATGQVRLIGVQIGGDLVCSDGEFSSTTKDALNLQSAAIQNVFILRALTAPININVTSAQIGVMVDEPTAWAKGSILNGLVYGSLSGNAPTDAAQRIAWLKQQSDEHLGEDDSKQDFRPQPWKQLQKVLREMGHEADAREVGVAFQNQLRKADRIGQITDARKAKNILPVVRRQFLRGLHRLFGALAGYGYRPMRLFMSLVGLWLFCAIAYWWLALPPYNALGPSDPLVFQNTNYAACTTLNQGNWMLCEPLPAEYTTFSPLAYSLDILLPLVDLGQEKRWGPLIPTPERHFCVELLSFSPAHWVRILNWVEILLGWVGSLLFVAIVSGMSRRSEMDK